ncbi:MAG: phytoene/squalene synthase family protein [Pseudomonadota bacterium]
MTDFQYCGDLVRQYDTDRYVLSLLYPKAQREALWALFAFNHEIAKTREVVTETATGLIRLQWWRDAVGKIYDGEILEHEVVKPLADVIKRYDLSRETFEHSVYAREFDVEDRQPTDMQGMLKYAELTTAPLNELVLKVLGEEAEDDVLRDVSVHFAVVGLLRAVPFHLHQRRCYLPESLMAGHGVSVSKLYDWKKYEALVPVVESILEEISAYAGTTAMRSRFLKASHKLSAIYLKQIVKSGYNVFDPQIQIEPPFKVLRVWMGGF